MEEKIIGDYEAHFDKQVFKITKWCFDSNYLGYYHSRGTMRKWMSPQTYFSWKSEDDKILIFTFKDTPSYIFTIKDKKLFSNHEEHEFSYLAKEKPLYTELYKEDFGTDELIYHNIYKLSDKAIERLLHISNDRHKKIKDNIYDISSSFPYSNRKLESYTIDLSTKTLNIITSKHQHDVISILLNKYGLPIS